MPRAFPFALLISALAMGPAGLAQHGSTGHAGGMGMGRPGNFGGGHMGAPSGRAIGGFSGRGIAGYPGGYQGLPVRGASSVPRMVSPAPNQAFNPGGYRIPTLTNGGSRWAGGGWQGERGQGWRDHDHDGYRSPYRGEGGYGYGYPNFVNSWDVLPWGLGYSDFSDNSDMGEPASVNGGPQQAEAAAPEPAYAAPEDSGYRPGYGSEMPAPPPPERRPAEPIAPEPELTLIFRDGHQQPIRNYVITQNTIVVLDQAASGRQKRIPLTEIDIPATEQAAREAGLDFNPPA